MKKLVVYYSYTCGNTRRIAEEIARKIDADLLSLETEKPYTGSYQDVVDQGLDEVKRGYTPKLKPFSVNPADYDEIIIGTPTWWYEMAPAVLSFMKQTDFTNKLVGLFQTNAGWPGDCLEHMAEQAKAGKVIAEGLFTFSADDADRNRMTSSQKDVDAFIEKL
ncbi:MAG: flavodoxin [Lactimicrobium sp.]|jgi:flavodoxin|uniref:flavodoxin family protein n=1 Tax=Lactimicrobium sp. TaxID=2563780 RepID=UPI002F353542